MVQTNSIDIFRKNANSEKFIKFSKWNDKFQYSLPYFLILIAISWLGFGVKIDGEHILVAPMMGVMLIVLAYNLIASYDLMPSILSICLISMIPCDMYNSGVSDYILTAPFAIVTCGALVCRFFIFKNNFGKGKMTKYLVIYSLAVMCGGLFSGLYLKQFQKITCIFILLGIGFMQLCFYSMWQNTFGKDSNKEETVLKFAKLMAVVVVVVLGFYAISYIKAIPKFLESGMTILSFQWKNNTSNMLLLTTPFAFYLANATKHKVSFFILGCLSYFVMMLSKCSGAILFGSVTVPLLILYAIIKADSKTRKKYLCLIIFAGVMLFTFMIVNYKMFYDLIIEKIVTGGSNRMPIYMEATRVFLKYPIFGVGYAYTNTDIYHHLDMGIFFMHSTFFQHIANHGIVGTLAYIPMAVYRLKTLVGKYTCFNVHITLAFLGFAMYSMVNTGMSAPIPFIMLCTAFVVLTEKYNASHDENKDTTKSA